MTELHTPMLTYRINQILDAGAADELFERLTLTGLGAFCGVEREHRWQLTFDFSCGCGVCPTPGTLEEARELVEAVLQAEDLEFELTGAEMLR